MQYLIKFKKYENTKINNIFLLLNNLNEKFINKNIFMTNNYNK